MIFFEELDLLRSINDPIHGVIRVSMNEMQVIQDPLFRRLHHVRQNSFLYKVFPSAKHTRFEHSIGVMNYAHQMFLAILENGYTARIRGDIAESSEFYGALDLGVGVDLSQSLSQNGDTLKQTFIELRLAALLHDIGHGPLSHLFDAFAPNIEEFMLILRSDEMINKDTKFIQRMEVLLEKYVEKQLEKGNKDIRIEHEHVSSYFTYKVLNRTVGVTKEQIYNILTILKPELSLGKRLISIFDREFDVLPILNDIVASAPIDCDRMDYLKRDSYFAGVPYGNYSESRVLKSMLAYAKNDGKIRLGLKRSGLHAIENFLQARYEMYVQVYGHKTNEACRAMLNFVTEENGLNFVKWSKKSLTANDFEELYTSLTDEEFVNHLMSELGEERRSALRDIKDRNLWKRVYEVEEFIDQKDKKTLLSECFSESFDKMKEEFGEEKFKIYTDERFPLKDMDAGAQLLEKSTRGFYVISPVKIRESSQIISSLNNGLRIMRLYSVDKENATEYKKYAVQNIMPLLNDVANKREKYVPN